MKQMENKQNLLEVGPAGDVKNNTSKRGFPKNLHFDRAELLRKHAEIETENQLLYIFLEKN